MTELNAQAENAALRAAEAEIIALRDRVDSLREALSSVRDEICSGPVSDVLWHDKGETTVDFICNTLGDDWTYDKWAEATK